MSATVVGQDVAAEGAQENNNILRAMNILPHKVFNDLITTSLFCIMKAQLLS